MKVIYLLNKIANGEEVPKTIKYDYDLYIYEEQFEDYYCEEKDLYLMYKLIGEGEYKMSFSLNIEVEIIEDKPEPKPITKKDLEALGYAFGEMRKALQNGWNKSLNNEPFKEDKKIEKLERTKEDDILVNGKSLLNKIDEIIDKVNKINIILSPLKIDDNKCVNIEYFEKEDNK